MSHGLIHGYDALNVLTNETQVLCTSNRVSWRNPSCCQMHLCHMHLSQNRYNMPYHDWYRASVNNLCFGFEDSKIPPTYYIYIDSSWRVESNGIIKKGVCAKYKIFLCCKEGAIYLYNRVVTFSDALLMKFRLFMFLFWGGHTIKTNGLNYIFRLVYSINYISLCYYFLKIFFCRRQIKNRPTR